MRTTLNIDDELMRAAKRLASEEGVTMTRLIEDALRARLAPSGKTAKPYRLRLVTMKGRLLPGVDLADRDSLYDRMDRDG